MRISEGSATLNTAAQRIMTDEAAPSAPTQTGTTDATKATSATGTTGVTETTTDHTGVKD